MDAMDMEAAPEDQDQEKQEGDEMSGADDEELDGKAEYVKKEFFARPYESNSGVLEEVQKTIVDDSRARLTMRISRARKEFGQDGFNFMDKDAGEYFVDCKGQVKNIQPSRHKKVVLEGGFQAAHTIENIQTQTYFGRSVNKAAQYNPDDFIGELSNFKDDENMEEKLDKFIDKVAYRVEEALQSNEIINVFQDDFEMLASEMAAASGKINSVKMAPRTFSESDYCN